MTLLQQRMPHLYVAMVTEITNKEGTCNTVYTCAEKLQLENVD